MKFRKVYALFLVAGSLLAGCNDESKIMLLGNSQFTLYNQCDESSLFYQPSSEEFTNLYNSNLNYLILFSEEGCSACEAFEPIIKKYVEETHQFVIKVEGKDEFKIKEEYREKFFPNSVIMTPSIFIKENGDNIYQVEHSKYMGTYTAFKRHMDSKYKTSKCSYFAGEIPGKSPVISNYTCVSFHSNDTFKNKISSKLLNTQKDALISSNYKDNFMTVFEKGSNGEFEVVRTTPITDELDDETIAKFL